MKNLDNYISELKKQLPDIEERLNIGANASELEELEVKVQCKLPPEFKELYARGNGEKTSVYTGLIAGLAFMPLEQVLSEFDYLKTSEDEMMVMGTPAIKEDSIKNHVWIPFAFDGSRAYIAMDLTPSKEGKKGQIITIDYEYDTCYLLADSLADLFGKLTAWLQQGILLVDHENEPPFITEQSGHIFNSLDELTMRKEAGEEKFVPLPVGYWEEYYQDDLKKRSDGSNVIALSHLVKVKRMLISEERLSCTPFAYMENLKELIFHDCEIEDLHVLAQVPQLQKLIFARCTFKGEDLSVLASAPKLKEIGINDMAGDGLSSLQEIKSLKSLNVRKVNGIDEKSFSGFVKLQTLSLKDLDIHDGSFIGNMKSLKILNLDYLTMDNLDFLKNLTKLVEFELITPAANEDGLAIVQKLDKLKSFIYPVKNLEIYEGHPSLKTIGLSPDVTQGFEVFANSQVESFIICDMVSEQHMKQIEAEFERYVKINSFGCRGRG